MGRRADLEGDTQPLLAQTVSSCQSCPAWRPGCAWSGNVSVEHWKKGRVVDREFGVYHFGDWDATPDKHCPKKGLVPRGMK